MLQEWRAHGATTYAGYILGFPHDTRESILRDVEIIKRELPIELLEFYQLTPLPGSEDHRTLLGRGDWMDPDLNKYDLHHRVTHHAKMSDSEWDAVYREAWSAYYNDSHLETVIRRAAANSRGRPRATMRVMLWFSLMFQIEHLHPLEGGIFRRKVRRDRRPEMPREHPLAFYPKYAAETAAKAIRYAKMIRNAYRIYSRVMRDHNRGAYRDIAILPPKEDELETLTMFTATSGGAAAVAKKHWNDDQRAKAATHATSH
jgi:hypothetical protein